MAKSEDEQLQSKEFGQENIRKLVSRKDNNINCSIDSSDNSHLLRKIKRRRKRHLRKKHRKNSNQRDRKKKKKRRRSPSISQSDSGSDSNCDNESSEREQEQEQEQEQVTRNIKKVVNQRLINKLAERGETLEEREQRRTERRAARITERFGYTNENNPFNDPNLASTFTWKKKDEKLINSNCNEVGSNVSRKKNQGKIIDEIEKVRKRRKDYEESKEEMERIRAEESRMKELENYDEWARKEEIFHSQQQRYRSAIRLVEGREKPIDILAKNLLMFGLSSSEEQDGVSVKYKEKYNAMEEVEKLEVELEQPHLFIKDLKLIELTDLLAEINVFCTLEKDAGASTDEGSVLNFWTSLKLVTEDEIRKLNSITSAVHCSIENGSESKLKIVTEIQKMIIGQSREALEKMKVQVEAKVKRCILAGGRPVYDEKDGGIIDINYWKTVLDEIVVQLAKINLSNMHSKMLVRQLERLEEKKDELTNRKKVSEEERDEVKAIQDEEEARAAGVPENVSPDFGNLEEELGLANEVDMGKTSYIWQDKFRPRKPRYFNRVKTGYDWNKYNQTHYDHDNPPPKSVQGYKFNIFYPDLIDRTKTPTYFLESTISQEFCILRFQAGPPYEDIAFKIINREWNKSRKRGFKCTFERGVLSLYFNFKTHWYRK